MSNIVIKDLGQVLRVSQFPQRLCVKLFVFSLFCFQPYRAL